MHGGCIGIYKGVGSVRVECGIRTSFVLLFLMVSTRQQQQQQQRSKALAPSMGYKLFTDRIRGG